MRVCALTCVCVRVCSELQAQGWHEVALHWYYEALRIERAALGQGHHDVAGTLRAIGRVLEVSAGRDAMGPEAAAGPTPARRGSAALRGGAGNISDGAGA